MKNKRNLLLAQLHQYQPYDEHEAQMLQDTILFIQKNKDCFLRSNLKGHLTASAWIVDNTFQFALLTHHQKLNKWIQLGGHADGNENMLEVALQEAKEESGLESLHIFQETIFDVDVHTIPTYQEIPEHIHFDIRFILIANRYENLIKNYESKQLAWLHLWDIHKFNSERSVMRMVRKTIKQSKF
ncbi:MAG: NUDIX hydrolase [Cytophagales bacterium]|nr:NUDIX hydrolase [Cytophagales bacterium]MDW8385000.1 NUDIX hydrolase [Flammeovirgaceae bacterium]